MRLMWRRLRNLPELADLLAFILVGIVLTWIVVKILKEMGL